MGKGCCLMTQRVDSRLSICWESCGEMVSCGGGGGGGGGGECI